MFVRINFPTVIDGLGRVAANQIIALTGAEALPLIAAGNASPDPELDALKAKARQLGQNSDWEQQPRFHNLRPRAIVATATQESFDRKLSEAVKQKLAQRRHKPTKQTRTRAGTRAEARARYLVLHERHGRAC